MMQRNPKRGLVPFKANVRPVYPADRKLTQAMACRQQHSKYVRQSVREYAGEPHSGSRIYRRE